MIQKTYNLADIIRMRKSYGLNFEGSIAEEHLRKVGPPYDLKKKFAVDVNFKLLQDIVKNRAPKNIDQDTFAVHVRAFDCLKHLKRQDFGKNLAALIKKYNLNHRFKKCLIFYGNHMSFLNRGKENKIFIKSNSYAKKLKKEIESLGLNCQLSEQVEDGEKDPKIRSTRTDEDFIAMATAKCFVVGQRGFSWLAASINPNEVIWDLQDPPNFPWIVNRKDYLDLIIKGYEFQIKNKS